MRRELLIISSAALIFTACGQDDPQPTGDAGALPDAGAAPDVDTDTNVDVDTDAAPEAGTCAPDGGALAAIDETACMAATGDYVLPAGGDAWDSCVSDLDANVYAPFNPSIGTIARVAGFEMMAPLLWDHAGTPTPQDFTAARLIYLTAEGLESRLVRREDEHYPPVMNAAGLVVACGELPLADQQAHPERCVGPARMVPIVNEAFTSGIAGQGDPRVHAARIEATLLWFFYVSVHKEVITCTARQADCDSAYAYYTGGRGRTDEPLGLARRVWTETTRTHDRVWDGILAMRCWRDLDNPAGTATNLVLRDRALSQLDRAAMRGVAVIVRARLQHMLAACGDTATQAADWAFLQLLGPVLDREASARDATRAAALRTELARTDPATVDAEAFSGALDAIFPCP